MRRALIMDLTTVLDPSQGLGLNLITLATHPGPTMTTLDQETMTTLDQDLIMVLDPITDLA